MSNVEDPGPLRSLGLVGGLPIQIWHCDRLMMWLITSDALNFVVNTVCIFIVFTTKFNASNVSLIVTKKLEKGRI